MSAMVEEGLYEPRAVRPWVVWVLFLVPILGTAHLLWWHVELLAKIAPAFYLPIVAALPLALVTVWAVHRLRNRHSSWILWAVLPVLPLCLLLLRRPTASVVAVLMTGASLSAGRIVARLLRVPESLPVLAGLTIHFSVGLAISTVVLFLLGMAGLLNWAMCAALLLPALLFTRFWWIEIRTAWNRWREFLSSGEAKSPVVTTVLVWSGILLLLAVASAATPALHGDSLRFHLALAKIYATQASLAPPTFLAYAYYPQGYEVQLTLLHLLGGIGAANMASIVHYAFVLMAGSAIALTWGLSRTATLLGSALCLAIPFMHFTGSTAKNDLLLSLYLLSALLCLLLHLTTPSTGLLLATALLLGAAAGVKHTVLFGGVPIALLFLWQISKHPKRWRVLGGALLIGASAGLFWHVRTWLATGDPFFPPQIAGVSQIGVLSAESVWERYAILPYSLQFRGRIHFESHSDNTLGVVLLLSGAALMITRRRRVTETAIVSALFAAGFLLLWSAVLSVLRYVIPAVVILVAFGSARIMALACHADRSIRFAAVAAVSYGFLFSLPVTIASEAYAADYLLGRTTEEAALAKILPGYEVVAEIRKHAAPEDKVLSVGNWAVYYAPFPGQVNQVYRATRIYAPSDLQHLQSDHYRFVILPEAPNGGELEAALAKWRPRLLKAAGGFRLYELAR